MFNYGKRPYTPLVRRHMSVEWHKWSNASRRKWITNGLGVNDLVELGTHQYIESSVPTKSNTVFLDLRNSRGGHITSENHGSGVSNLLREILLLIGARYSPINVQMVILCERIDHISELSSMPHVLDWSINPFALNHMRKAWLNASHKLTEEAMRRRILFARNNVPDIHEYRRKFHRNTDMESVPDIIVAVHSVFDGLLFNSEPRLLIENMLKDSVDCGIKFIFAGMEFSKEFDFDNSFYIAMGNSRSEHIHSQTRTDIGALVPSIPGFGLIRHKMSHDDAYIDVFRAGITLDRDVSGLLNTLKD